MNGVTWVDIALILVVLWSVAAGLRSGLARVVVGFVAVIAAFLGGFWFYRLVAIKLTPWISDTTVANFVGFFVIFLGVLILGSLIAAVLSKLFAWVGLSWFNRLLGGAAGFFRGVLLIAALVDVLVAFAPSPTPEMLERSVVVPYISSIAGWLVDLAPRTLKDSFDQQMQNLRQHWGNPPNKHAQTA
ncbi:MAG TPA: CvpA family protein [Bryobacteraceae bacterium]|nr:CvpA family protein [Bryobacteraceae bacterium]